MSEQQIQTGINTTLNGGERFLGAYWNFNGGTTTDLSRAGHDGVLQGDVEVVEVERFLLRAVQADGKVVDNADREGKRQNLTQKHQICCVQGI